MTPNTQTNHIKQFIEDAIKGGWWPQEKGFNAEYSWFYEKKYRLWHFSVDDVLQIRLSSEAILLDSAAWRAVGKQRGWDMDIEGLRKECHINMHRFLDRLIEGDTIDTALSKL